MTANEPVATPAPFNIITFVSQFVNADKIGGWVRAGVAAGAAIVIANVPALKSYLTPDVQAALGVIGTTVAVGLWSQLTKSDSAKIAMVEKLDDVKNVVVTKSATDGVAAAAADPARPKVVTASQP
jgi:hypothetical protein